jgi:predicted HTH transcriptional regulator
LDIFFLDSFLLVCRTLVLIDGKPTYAGLLFFGTRDSIQRYFVDFRIDLFEIPGISISDAKVRYTYRLPEQENLWDYYFILFERITMRINKPFKLDNMGFAKEDYPYIDALREALVNMLMHADYFSPIKSRIRVFSDKIEFFNAGSYPKPAFSASFTARKSFAKIGFRGIEVSL